MRALTARAARIEALITSHGSDDERPASRWTAVMSSRTRWASAWKTSSWEAKYT